MKYYYNIIIFHLLFLKVKFNNINNIRLNFNRLKFLEFIL